MLLPQHEISSVCGIGLDDGNVSYDCNGTGSGENILVSETEMGSNEMELRGWLGAYMAPVMKTRDIPIFSFRESCRRQIIGTGKMKIIRSEMKFIEPYANPALV